MGCVCVVLLCVVRALQRGAHHVRAVDPVGVHVEDVQADAAYASVYLILRHGRRQQRGLHGGITRKPA